MELNDALNEFYFNAALYDLKMMNMPSNGKGLTYNSLMYLELIYYLGRKATVSNIASLLNISKSAVTIKMKELEKQGLILKESNPKDRRQSFLHVNEDATPRFKMYKRLDDDAIRKIKQRYSKEDINKFCDMLNIVSSTSTVLNKE